MTIYELPSQIRKVRRLTEMASILAKYELISASKKLNPVRVISRLLGRDAPPVRVRGRIYREIIEGLGTTYIKFGQWLSVRPEFVPPDIIEEFEKLQDRLPPMRFGVIKRIIERETEKPLGNTFSHFDLEPLSTASIAQVHLAILRTGETVAVKVQRPNLKKLIDVDLEILESVARRAVKRWPHLAVHRFDELLFAFKSTLMDEISFSNEANNQMRMAKLFEDTPWIRVPSVYTDYSTERLLVMEYLPGLKSAQKDQFADWELNPKLLTGRLADAMFRQIFEFGFFQSDPHPGNILFMKNNGIGFVDFGIIDSFDRALREKLIEWIYASVYRDVDLFVHAFLEVSKPLGAIDMIQFRNDVIRYLDEVHFQSASRISFARLFRMTNRLQYKHRITSPPTFISIFKTISTLEGLARRIDPEFDWRLQWGPKLRVILEKRFSPEAIGEKYWNIVKDYDSLLAEYPDDFRQIVKRIKDAKLTIELNMPELGEHVREIKQALLKLASALVTSSVIFGLFLIGRGQGPDFPRWLLYNLQNFWWVILALLMVVLYFRRP